MPRFVQVRLLRLRLILLQVPTRLISLPSIGRLWLPIRLIPLPLHWMPLPIIRLQLPIITVVLLMPLLLLSKCFLCQLLPLPFTKCQITPRLMLPLPNFVLVTVTTQFCRTLLVPTRISPSRFGVVRKPRKCLIQFLMALLPTRVGQTSLM